MSAGCEVATPRGICTVAAIGRCYECGRAFCMTHQARQPPTSYIDWCMPCKVERDRPEQIRMGQESDSRRWIAERAVQFLAEAEVARQNVMHESRTFLKGGLLRRSKYVSSTSRLYSGWLIGEFEWDYSYETAVTGDSGRKPFLTMLVDRKASAMMPLEGSPTGELQLLLTHEGRLHAPQGWYTHLADSTSAVEQGIRRLAR